MSIGSEIEQIKKEITKLQEELQMLESCLEEDDG